jgi:hypothetical protein
VRRRRCRRGHHGRSSLRRRGAVGSLELFTGGRRRGRGVCRRILGVRTRRWGRRRGLRRRWRAPLLRRRLFGRRTPLRGRTIRTAAGRWCAVTLRRTHGSAEGVQAFGRARLVARRLRRGEGWLLVLRRAPGWRCSWSGRGLLRVAAPLLWWWLLRRRRIVRLRLRWRRAPLRSRGRLWRRRWSRRRVVRGWGGHGLRRGRAWTRRHGCQRSAAGETKLAGGLVASAAPRADDHEPYSRNLRHPGASGTSARAAYPVSPEKARNRSGLWGPVSAAPAGAGAPQRSCSCYGGPARSGPSGPSRRRRGRPCP